MCVHLYMLIDISTTRGRVCANCSPVHDRIENRDFVSTFLADESDFRITLISLWPKPPHASVSFTKHRQLRQALSAEAASAASAVRSQSVTRHLSAAVLVSPLLLAVPGFASS